VKARSQKKKLKMGGKKKATGSKRVETWAGSLLALLKFFDPTLRKKSKNKKRHKTEASKKTGNEEPLRD